MGCGLAYEALNNAGHTERNLIVILNDNDHSIAPNVGAMNKYLTGVMTNPVYNRIRDEVKDLLSMGPGGAKGIVRRVASRTEESVKSLFVPGMLFEELGFRYIGPVDAAAAASRLAGPSTKLSNVNFGSRSDATTALNQPPSRYVVFSRPFGACL